MGTRADFYIGTGDSADWLGSIAMDGYPDGYPKTILNISTEDEFRSMVMDILSNVDYATLPERGWPWPWDDSRMTDYAYAFEDGTVLASCFGSCWLPARLHSAFHTAVDYLKDRHGFDINLPAAEVPLDIRSGLIII